MRGKHVSVSVYLCVCVFLYYYLRYPLEDITPGMDNIQLKSEVICGANFLLISSHQYMSVPLGAREHAAIAERL